MQANNGIIRQAWLNIWDSVKNSLGIEFFNNRDASSGYPSLSGFALKLKNSAGTITSTLTHAHTSARAITIQNKSYTLAGLDDLADPSKSFVNIYSAGNLIANGFCETGTNYNFSHFSIDNVYVKSGARHSFKLLDPVDFQDVYVSDTDIAFDFARPVKLFVTLISGDIAGLNAVTKQCFLYLIAIDSDGSRISQFHVDTYPLSAQTTLAQALLPGDTSFFVADATGWKNTAADYTHNITYWPYIPTLGLYGYQENSGKINAKYTYSQKSTLYTGDSHPLWLDNGINTATGEITINPGKYPSGWPGEALQAGTPIRQIGIGGASHDYAYSQIPEVGVNNIISTRTMPPGTHKVRLGGIFNYEAGGVNGEIRLANIYLSYA